KAGILVEAHNLPGIIYAHAPRKRRAGKVDGGVACALKQEAVARLIVSAVRAYNRAAVVDPIRVGENCARRIHGSENATHVGKAMDCERPGVQIRAHHLPTLVHPAARRRPPTRPLDFRPPPRPNPPRPQHHPPPRPPASPPPPPPLP